jgi:hypothetical protein
LKCAPDDFATLVANIDAAIFVDQPVAWVEPLCETRRDFASFELAQGGFRLRLNPPCKIREVGSGSKTCRLFGGP